MIARILGALLLIYAAAYTAHFIFSSLYDAGPIWTVFNVISGVSILVALLANGFFLRSSDKSTPATVLFYANALLAIWFFRNWLNLLSLESGESVSTHSDVLWMLIAGLIPLVLATTGWRLWQAKKFRART